jgi:hypothetical protein
MKAAVWCEAIAYVLVGVGGFSFVSNHSDLAYGLTLLAGGVDKFGPRLFSSSRISEPENEEVEN